MANFAELDGNNTVLRVIVVNNTELIDNSGVEQEYIGVKFCRDHFGGTWVQTSYNGNARFNFAGIGFSYDAARDAFISPQPYKSWPLDERTCRWIPPVPCPTDGKTYRWDEPSIAWVQINQPGIEQNV